MSVVEALKEFGQDDASRSAQDKIGLAGKQESGQGGEWVSR